MSSQTLRSRKTWVGFAVGMVATGALPFVVGMAIDALNGPRPSPRCAKARADVRGIEEALELYAAEHGRVPTTQEGLAALVPTQLLKIPVDPWGNPYVYLREAGRGHVVSYGSDGEPGGEGNAADIDSADLARALSAGPKSALIDGATATALLLGSILLVPFVGYLATDQSQWAVGVLAGAAGFFVAFLFTLGVVVVLDTGIRASALPLIGLPFAGGTVAVSWRIRYSDGAVMAAMAALVAAFWMLSGMVVS
jgi:general secretion pathway protein G